MDTLDGPLYTTLQTLPAFPFGQLIRPDAVGIAKQKKAFFANRTLPTFTYSRAERFDLPGFLQKLDSVESRIASFSVSADVRNLYHEKCAEIRARAALISAIARKNDQEVTACADLLYGTPTQSESDLAQEFTSMLAQAHELHTHKTPVTAELFTQMVRMMLERYNLSHWKIVPTNRSSVSIIHGKGSPSATIKIPKKFLSSRARAARVLTHEIEAHALRTKNGFSSSILLLGRGLAGYIATDEGLAITMQQKLEGAPSRDPGFWDAWAAALSITHGFTDTFDVLCRAQTALNIAMNKSDAEHHAQNSAWRLMLRLNRGIHAPGASGIGYRRDHIYRSGLLAVRETIATHGESTILPILFAGHAALHHIPTLQKLDITGETPALCSNEVVRAVMQSHGSRSHKK